LRRFRERFSARFCGVVLTLDSSVYPVIYPDCSIGIGMACSSVLRRAIENVIRNAIRHAPEGTAVEASLEAANGQAVLRIRDYGPGVPKDALPRIFDAFYRVETDRDRASGGAGLGLSIARRAVELHNGTIRARNAGPGLLVEIDLPD
jgi:two-component system sensor histidine kinase CpxA